MGHRRSARSIALLTFTFLGTFNLTLTNVSSSAGNEAVLAGAMPRVFAAGRYIQGDLSRHQAGPAGVATRPDLSGKWQMERAENLSGFMQAIGYNFILAKAASFARVTQTIEQNEEQLRFIFEVNPPLLSPRRESVVPVGAAEVSMSDDAGRQMLLLNPRWDGEVFRAGLRYLDPHHELTIDRYLEDDRMVEHVRYPGRAIEMRRIFRREL